MTSLRLLADENFPRIAVTALRLAGYSVAWIAKDKPGSTDHEILERATKERRIILTFDHDFSQLALRADLSLTLGIILFTIPLDDPKRVADKSVQILKSRNDWAGHFSIIDEKYVRMIPLKR